MRARAFPIRPVWLVVALTGLLLVSCGDDDSGVGPVGPVGPQGEGDGIAGSGTVVSETRPVAGFDTVILAGEGSVIISRGDSGLVIEIDDNLAQYLVAEVQDSALRISTAPGIDIDPSAPPVYRVTAPELAAVELAGAGEISASGWSAGDFAVALPGVGDVTIADLTAQSLAVDLGGVGRVVVFGTAGEQSIAIGGPGEYDGTDLESRTAAITCADACTAILWATEALDVVIEGPGTVSYYGNPVLAQDIDALGTLVPLGNR